AETERQALLGNGLDPTLLYERARLWRALGDPRACAVALDAAGLPSHPSLGAQARALRAECEQGLP
ncbi:MAG: hypothetical protein H0V89_12105, partial [Deltaproteobacteria bacterium]|nr:hypothetical protein [Deltaproteobacteria bacterium]